MCMYEQEQEVSQVRWVKGTWMQKQPTLQLHFPLQAISTGAEMLLLLWVYDDFKWLLPVNFLNVN
jgi:hypothetical protein